MLSAIRFSLATLFAICLATNFGRGANAADLYWDGTGMQWDVASNWSTVPSDIVPDPGAAPSATDIAAFNVDGLANATTTVANNQAALGLVFSGTGASVLRSSAATDVFSLGGSGITVNPGAGPVSIDLARIAIPVIQTWANNSASPLTVSGYVSQSEVRGQSGRTLTIDGSGPISLSGPVNYNSYITKNGTGTLTLGGITDNIGLGIVVNAGTVVLAKTSSSTPGVEVHAIGSYFNTLAGGRLQLAGTNGDQIWDDSKVVVTSGTFDTNGRNETLAGIDLAGTGIDGNGALINSAEGTTSTLQRAGTTGFYLRLTGDATIGGTGNLSIAGHVWGKFDLTKIGSGTLSLPSQSYETKLIVNEGTLAVSGVGELTLSTGAQITNNSTVTGSVIAGSGSTAKGSGSFNQLSIRDGAILAPGNSAGILSANTLSLVDAATSDSPTLEVEIGGISPGVAFDQVHVSGALALSGVLQVSFINGFSPALGDSFDILDFGTLTGNFSTRLLPALNFGLGWDLSQLYTNGTLRIKLAGDFNNNGIVDAGDYIVWRNSNGQSGANLPADANNDGRVNSLDYPIWRANFGATAAAGSGGNLPAGAVPEPASFALAGIGTITFIARRRSPSLPQRI